LDNPGRGAIAAPTSGGTSFEGVQAPGFVYDPVIKKFVGWGGGSSVYVLDPDTWVWTEISPADGNTVNPGK
ncbi:hypothetical protein MNBD_NITROSPIRAE01-196, partial [hydrothermal vent metagenome]